MKIRKRKFLGFTQKWFVLLFDFHKLIYNYDITKKKHKKMENVKKYNEFLNEEIGAKTIGMLLSALFLSFGSLKASLPNLGLSNKIEQKNDVLDMRKSMYEMSLSLKHLLDEYDSDWVYDNTDKINSLINNIIREADKQNPDMMVANDAIIQIEQMLKDADINDPVLTSAINSTKNPNVKILTREFNLLYKDLKKYDDQQDSYNMITYVNSRTQFLTHIIIGWMIGMIISFLILSSYIFRYDIKKWTKNKFGK